MQSEQPSSRTQTSPSVAELVALVNGLKTQLDSQRTELEQKIVGLQGELDQVRQRPIVSGQVVRSETGRGSRRRMLKGMFVGVAGAAALGVATSVRMPDAQAATFDFTNVNNSNGLTTTINGTGTTSVPLFTFNNSESFTGTPTDPTALPIGVYSVSANSFGVYGQNTNGSASGVFGSNGSATPVASGTFFANNNAGVVGSSTLNTGTLGQSQQSVGVEGLSGASFGVVGVSNSSVGGAFAGPADSTANLNQGAAIRLGVRPTAGAAPSGTAYTHRQGELYLDAFARIYVCNAGTNGSVGLSPNSVKPTAGAIPGLPDGAISNAGSSWQLLTPMVLRSGSPAAALGTDTAFHTVGELWLDTTTGSLYVCTVAGANNPNGTNTSLLGYYGYAPTQVPIFVAVGSGGGGGGGGGTTSGTFQFLPAVQRITLAGGAALRNNVPSTINIRTAIGQSNAIGVAGVVTIYGAFGGGEYLTSGPGPSGGGVAVTTSNLQNKNASFAAVGLDASGVMNFMINGSPSVALTYDVVGFYK